MIAGEVYTAVTVSSICGNIGIHGLAIAESISSCNPAASAYISQLLNNFSRIQHNATGGNFVAVTSIVPAIRAYKEVILRAKTIPDPVIMAPRIDGSRAIIAATGISYSECVSSRSRRGTHR